MNTRTLNFTGRRRILREMVELEIVSDDKRFVVNGRLDLSTLSLASGTLVVELYRGFMAHRKVVGPISQITDINFEVPAFAPPQAVLCNIRVVSTNSADRGQILAAALRLRPLVKSLQQDDFDEGLLDFVPDDELGQRLWRLDTTGDKPEIRMNSRVNWKSMAKHDYFHMLVIPQIAEGIADWVWSRSEARDTDTLEENETVDLWKQLFSSWGVNLDDYDLESETDRADWGAAVVTALCQLHKFADLMRDSQESSEDA